MSGTAGSIEGNRGLVGALGRSLGVASAGAGYVFERSAGLWSEVQELDSITPAWRDCMGSAASLSGGVAVLGAPQDTGGAATGTGFVFELADGSWTETKELTPSQVAPGAFYGRTVAVDGIRTVLGAPVDNAKGVGAGVAVVFAHNRHPNGDLCTHDTECASGFCVSSVCCNEPCGANAPDSCQGCSEAVGASADGVCTPLTGMSCDNGLFCDGADRCAAGLCTDHFDPPCPGPDNDDDCNESCNEATHECGEPDPDGSACASGLCFAGACAKNLGAGCELPADCQSGYCVEQVCCLQQDCAPYRCGPLGACLASCSASTECAAGFQCTSGGQCVPAIGPEALVKGPGCSCTLPGAIAEPAGAPRNSGRGARLLLAILALLAFPGRRAPAPPRDP